MFGISKVFLRNNLFLKRNNLFLKRNMCMVYDNFKEYKLKGKDFNKLFKRNDDDHFCTVEYNNSWSKKDVKELIENKNDKDKNLFENKNLFDVNFFNLKSFGDMKFQFGTTTLVNMISVPKDALVTVKEKSFFVDHCDLKSFEDLNFENYLNYETIKEMVKKNYLIYHKLERLKTDNDIIYHVLSQNGNMLKYVPYTSHSQRLSEVAFNQDISSFIHIKREYQTLKMCRLALEKDFTLISYIDNKFYNHLFSSNILYNYNKSFK
jgi:hypothetical protein